MLGVEIPHKFAVRHKLNLFSMNMKMYRKAVHTQSALPYAGYVGRT